MKAAIFHNPFDITMEETGTPSIQPTDILIKVSACGICGSDLHMYKLGLFTDIICRQSPQGLIPGHEFSGEIAEVGSEVQGLGVGDRVVAYSNGGFAEYAAVTAYPGFNVYRIPEAISDNAAATLEPLGNSIHAVMKGKHTEEEVTAMVFGAGIIGLGTIQSLRALDVKLKTLIVVDMSDNRLEMAKQLGADEVINARHEDPFEKAKEIAGSFTTGISLLPEVPLVNVIYDCVGLIKDRPGPSVIEQAVKIIFRNGRIVVHGIFEAPASVDYSLLVAKEAQIIGSYGASPEDSAKAIDLMESGAVDRDSIITHEFPLDQIKEAFDTQADTDKSIKVIVKP